MSDVSQLFRILADRRRRQLLWLLCRVETVEIGDESWTQYRCLENPRPARTDHASDAGDDRALEIQLLHKHLPLLESANLIEWDRETRTVSRGPDFEEIEPVLQVLVTNADAFPGELI